MLSVDYQSNTVDLFLLNFHLQHSNVDDMLEKYLKFKASGLFVSELTMLARHHGLSNCTRLSVYIGGYLFLFVLCTSIKHNVCHESLHTTKAGQLTLPHYIVLPACMQGAISRLKVKSNEQLHKAKEELAVTRTRLEAELSELRKTASKTKSALQLRSQELQMFLNYKEKEYPVKVVRIEQLKEQCELMRERNEIERMELELQMAEERERCQQQLDAIRQTLKKRATEVSNYNIV